MATPADHTEENNTPPTTACPAWCMGHDADGPGGIGDHVHEAAPALVSCIALERTTDETGTIHHHPTATELTLVRYQYPHDSDTCSTSATAPAPTASISPWRVPGG